MTHSEFFRLLKTPGDVMPAHADDLKELVDSYPYFAPARLFYAKALQRSDSVLFTLNLKFSSIYTANRSWLYYYIYPDKKVSSEPYKRKRQTKSSGDYFDMISAIEAEGGDTGLSLRNLADRFKSARELVSTPAKSVRSENSGENITDDYFAGAVISGTENVPDESKLTGTKSEPQKIQLKDAQLDVKKLIREHNYSQALELLKQLNLIYPKKSIYFADQIRFLEKVIANTQK